MADVDSSEQRVTTKLQLRTYPCMLFPLDPKKIAWDYLVMVLVAINVVELPFTTAFTYADCQVWITSRSRHCRCNAAALHWGSANAASCRRHDTELAQHVMYTVCRAASSSSHGAN